MNAALLNWVPIAVLLLARHPAPVVTQATFSTPDEAAKALFYAIEAGNCPLFLSIAGPRMAALWNTGDEERDTVERDLLLDAAHRQGLKTAPAPAGRVVLYVGGLPDPFPEPLIRTRAGWRFDDESGAAEVAARTIHRNEVAAVEMCNRFRDAELAYRELDNGGRPAFAGKIRSSPGRHDGLFWLEGGEDQSPLGPHFAAAAFAEPHPEGELHPLFGYYYKILAAQGPDAPGGALDYRTKGLMQKGFALIAWPARYGVDGRRSFLISQFGDIYEKDLGPDTAHIAGVTEIYNPDRTWNRWSVDE